MTLIIKTFLSSKNHLRNRPLKLLRPKVIKHTVRNETPKEILSKAEEINAQKS